MNVTRFLMCFDDEAGENTSKGCVLLTKEIISRKKISPKLVYKPELDRRPAKHRHERLFRNERGDLYFEPDSDVESRKTHFHCGKRKCQLLTKEIMGIFKKANLKFNPTQKKKKHNPSENKNQKKHKKRSSKRKVGTWSDPDPEKGVMGKLKEEINELKKMMLKKFESPKMMNSTKKANEKSIPKCKKCGKHGHTTKEHREGKGYLGKNFIPRYKRARRYTRSNKRNFP